MFCTSCGKGLDAGAAFCGKCGAAVTGRRTEAGASIVVQDVVRSQVAVGDGNVQVQVTVDGVSRITERNDGVELRVREIPVPPATSRPSLVGRYTLIEETWQFLSERTSVQLFGAPGVGRSAVAEAVLRRMAEAGTRCVEIRPGNEPHTLESLYRRLMDVFFGVVWYQPDEAVVRLEVNRFDLSALIMVTDCDLEADDLSRLLGTFPNCTFLLTSHRQTLTDDTGVALEVDPLTSAQARELITRALGRAPAGLENVQWEEAYRLAGGQVQRLTEHIAFIRRSASRPGQTDLLNVPISEQIALLVAGLSEAARRVIVALGTYQVAIAPSAFAAVTGLSQAAGAAGELTAAGVIAADGPLFRIVPDAAALIAGERSDPVVAAEGILGLLAGPEPLDPHLVLAVARALLQAGDDTGTVKLTRAGAPAALALGAVGVWVALVALGVQAATRSRRALDLQFFLGEERTAALLRGDLVAAAAALAAIGDLIAGQQPAAATAVQQPAASGHDGAAGKDVARRVVRQGSRRGWLAGHPALVIAAVAVGVAVIAAVATASVISSGHPNLSVAGSWSDGPDSTFTFTAAGSGTYRVSLADKVSSTQCHVADDGTMSGSNGRYTGTIDLYPQNTTSTTGCSAEDGSARITFDIAANGASASVDLVQIDGNDCNDCKPQTWSRQS